MTDHITAPQDAEGRRAVTPVICYPTDSLPAPDPARMARARKHWRKTAEVLIPPREAACFAVKAGQSFRISLPQGAQVGDLNLWNAHDLSERFFSGKTRAIHGSHVSTGHTLYSNLPHLRAMALILEDSLAWYGRDDFGGAVHDVIGTRCDPYTGRLLSGDDYHYCCHSNLIRALAHHAKLSASEAETYVHDVLNVFMCTGFTRDTGQYFMKSSPVRPGDYLEFYAEIDLLVGLSACPGGDCSSEHSSDTAKCHPLHIEVWDPGEKARKKHQVPQLNPYSQNHGIG